MYTEADTMNDIMFLYTFVTDTLDESDNSFRLNNFGILYALSTVAFAKINKILFCFFSIIAWQPSSVSVCWLAVRMCDVHGRRTLLFSGYS